MAGKSSRRKGFGFEREVVNQAREIGLEADRMWGSDGRSAGHPADWDVEIAGMGFQCKRLKAIGALYRPQEGVFGQIFREDRGETMVLLRFSDFLTLMGDLRECGEALESLWEDEEAEEVDR